jgi:hypothetical protein
MSYAVRKVRRYVPNNLVRPVLKEDAKRRRLSTREGIWVVANEETDATTVLIIERLAASGWQRTASSVALDWANLVYEGPRSRLQVDYLPADTSLSLACVREDGEYELIVEFGEQLDEYLDLLVDVQDTLGPETWDDFVDRQLGRFPRVFAVLGEDEDDVVLLTRGDDSR